MRRDLGDFQTPPALVKLALKTLERLGILWRRALEPTCGHGAFIRGLLELDSPPREIQGIEIQDHYVRQARLIAGDHPESKIAVHKANIFEIDLARELAWTESGPLLVVGNPPWVTSAELGGLGSTNRPKKVNLKGLRGLDALTGRSNFDIAEYIWLKVLTELREEHPTVAFLCKTSVARNVLAYAQEAALPVTRAELYRIDAQKWFSAAVDACWFVITLGPGEVRYEASVFDSLDAPEPASRMGMARGRLVPNLAYNQRYVADDAGCPLTWRQGLKHDAASVMEVSASVAGFRNKLNEEVDIEPDYLYPLLKTWDVVNLQHPDHRFWVIVPQKRLGEDTRRLEQAAPKLWAYLQAHSEVFERRKSSVYQGKAPFSIFGIGDYAFAPYKVVTSGLHKRPHFRAVGPVAGRPVMVDDTCYYLSCRSPLQAAFIASLLQDEVCLEIINALVFWDAKRPITKGLLQRINLCTVLQRADRRRVLDRARAILRQLAGDEQADSASWPEDLGRLLVDDAPAVSCLPVG